MSDRPIPATEFGRQSAWKTRTIAGRNVSG
jgi:hypothetical protein